MRVLVISDIHANITALEAVLSSANNYETVWCLGDLVGYGPDPNECVDRVRELPNLTCVMGNHDLAAVGQLDAKDFNPEARAIVRWTSEALTVENKEFLRNLPETKERGPVTLVHGSPRHPVWEYLLDPIVASTNFEYFDTCFCFVGHTHLPVYYSLNNPSGRVSLGIPEPDQPIKLESRAILNPGSVGQPRDHDRRAAYAIFDLESLTWVGRRVGYDFRSVQERMEKAGLPERHIQRLASGW